VQRYEGWLFAQPAEQLVRDLRDLEREPRQQCCATSGIERAEHAHVVGDEREPEIAEHVVNLIVAERMRRLRRMAHDGAERLIVAAYETTPRHFIPREHRRHLANLIQRSGRCAHQRV
jgi:hypothetical protein